MLASPFETVTGAKPDENPKANAVWGKTTKNPKGTQEEPLVGKIASSQALTDRALAEEIVAKGLGCGPGTRSTN